MPRLVALVRLWCGWPERAGLSGGCPIAAGMFELDDVDGPVRQHVQAAVEEWRAWLAGMVRDALRLGHLRADLDVEQFVWELEAIYLGHHVAQRFRRDPDARARADTAIDALVARSRP